MNVKDRNELLVRLDTDMQWVKNQLSNHLHFHSRLNIVLVAVTLTTLATLLVTLLRT